MTLYDDVIKTLDKETGDAIIDIYLVQTVLEEVGITVQFDEELVFKTLKEYEMETSTSPIIPVTFKRGEEAFYINATMWMNIYQDCFYAIALYYDKHDLKPETV